MIILRPENLDISENIELGCSTRQGGVSPEPFDSLNMSTSRGDSEANVEQNRAMFLGEMKISASNLAQGKQVSRDGIEVVTRPGLYPACDAMITKEPGVFLSVLTADCAPVLIWTEGGDLVASVHSGWQGSEMNLLGKTLDRITDDYHRSPETLYMVIGPGLTQENFEVGPEFEQKFPPNYLQEFGDGRFKLNNNEFLRDTAVQRGIPAHHIEIMNYCTFEDGDLFFSHRRDKNNTGRMMSVIGIRDESD